MVPTGATNSLEHHKTLVALVETFRDSPNPSTPSVKGCPTNYLTLRVLSNNNYLTLSHYLTLSDELTLIIEKRALFCTVSFTQVFVLLRVFNCKSVPQIKPCEIIVSDAISRIWILIMQLPSSSRDLVASKEAIIFIGLIHFMNPISVSLSADSTSRCLWDVLHLFFSLLVLYVF